jgi:inner membrane protein
LDNLTHSLFGLTLARTPLGRAGRGVTAALLIGSNAPDIDIVATAGGAATYLEWHRGPTHGFVGIVALGLATAAIVVAARRLLRRQDLASSGGDGSEMSRDASFGPLAMAATAAVGLHVLMDVPTSYGTRFLSPFSWTWFGEDWFPIVDFYLLTILAAALWFGRSAPGRNAAVALTLMLGYYGFRATLHGRAIAAAPAVFGAQLPQRCDNMAAPGAGIDSWPRRAHGHAGGSSQRERAASRCLLEIAALPDFLSPFRWRLIAQLTNSYEVRTVDLLTTGGLRSSDARLLAARYPNQWTPAAVNAAAAPKARTFLGFSRFPAVSSTIDADGSATVVWSDLRFVAPDDVVRSRRSPRSLFVARVRVAADGTILSDRLGS